MRTHPKEGLIDFRSLDEGLNEVELLIPASALTIEPLKEDVRVQLKLLKTGEKLTAKGDVTFALMLECSRCLTEFRKEFTENLDVFFLPGFSESKEKGLSEDEVKTLFYGSTGIDLLPVIRDTILLAMPMKPLCSEDCKGLCPKCGKNLNEGPCGCKK
jgi:uncharacterized protein